VSWNRPFICIGNVCRLISHTSPFIPAWSTCFGVCSAPANQEVRGCGSSITASITTVWRGLTSLPSAHRSRHSLSGALGSDPMGGFLHSEEVKSIHEKCGALQRSTLEQGRSGHPTRAVWWNPTAPHGNSPVRGLPTLTRVALSPPLRVPWPVHHRS
jgi:hypothetical protein